MEYEKNRPEGMVVGVSVGVAMGVSVALIEGVAVGITEGAAVRMTACGSRYYSVRGSVSTHWTTFKPEKKSRMSEYWRL